jgi:hypothetical protein
MTSMATPPSPRLLLYYIMCFVHEIDSVGGAMHVIDSRIVEGMAVCVIDRQCISGVWAWQQERHARTESCSSSSCRPEPCSSARLTVVEWPDPTRFSPSTSWHTNLEVDTRMTTSIIINV